MKATAKTRLDRMARFIHSEYGHEDYRRSMHLSDIQSIMGEIESLESEVNRLRAGGCARDQRTTQWCAEAVSLQAEVTRLRLLLDLTECHLREARAQLASLGYTVPVTGNAADPGRPS